MPTTPSPYNYNRTRYARVPKRAKSGGLGCGIVALAMIVVSIAGVATPIVYFA